MKPYLPIVPGSVSRRTIKDMIGGEIESLIASGVLRVGDQLPSERDLAALLNVSRETVRRSIQNLEERGVVTVSRGTRTRVNDVRLEKPSVGMLNASSITGYSIDDVFGARIAIERSVILDVAMRADGRFISRLDVILDAQKNYFNDPIQYFICDRSFHVTIYRHCSNRLMSDMAVDLYTYMLESRRNIIDYSRAKRGYGDHLVIVDAIRAGEPEKAAQALELHVNRQYETSRMLHEGAQAGTNQNSVGGVHTNKAG